MQNLIKNGIAIEQDEWQVCTAEDSSAIPGNALLPVSFWENNGAEMVDSKIPFGAFVTSEQDIESLVPFLKQIALIAFEFGKFADGRAFSYARQLRTSYQYKGEIRAYGNFMPDQIKFLERCGFNAFSCRTTEERDIALSIKEMVTQTYQSDVLQEKPLFRRRG